MDEPPSRHPMEPQLCPTCQAPLPGGGVGGLCPACLFGQGAAETGGPETAGFTPPPISEIAPHFPALELIELLGREIGRAHV